MSGPYRLRCRRKRYSNVASVPEKPTAEKENRVILCVATHVGMRFYERIEPITAELVPLSHDLLFYLKHSEEREREKECEAFREHFERYCELIKDLKNENLIHQSYIPIEVFTAFSAVVKQMQDDANYWFDMAKLLFAGEYDKIDYDKGKAAVDMLLMHLAAAEIEVKKRLKLLCGDFRRFLRGSVN